MANSKSNQAPKIRTVNVGGSLKNPRFVVLHYSASTNLASTVAWLCDKRARASAHVVIGRGGEVEGLVPFDRCAWHAGASSWKSYNGLNNFSIGIELLNAGPVKESPEGFRTIVGNQLVEDVIEAKHKSGLFGYTHWQKYTDLQLESLDRLLGQLFTDFPSLVEIVGHDDITKRKSDPGPAFDEHMAVLKRKHDRY